MVLDLSKVKCFSTILAPLLIAKIDVSIPNFITQEYSTIDESKINKIFNSDWIRNGGYINVPECVGIGINVDFEKLKKQTFESRLKQNIPIRNDGSVGYSV